MMYDRSSRRVWSCFRVYWAEAGADRAYAVHGFAKLVRRNWGPHPIVVDVSHLNAGVRHETVALLGQAAAAYDISPIVALSLYEAPAVYAEARQAAAAGILRLALRVDYGELEKDD